jgi:hypothetical protein
MTSRRTSKVSRTAIRSYSELRRYTTLEERFRYMALHERVGQATFGFDRYINQAFYRSAEWRRIRNFVIDRDNGCDLGISGFEIHNRPTIHHLNPMTPRDIVEDDEKILDPEYLITTTLNTHNAIHFGDEGLLPRPFIERRPGDTKPW